MFGLQLHSSKTCWKALVIIILFFSFKGIIHVHLLKILITHNEKQIPLLNLLISCIPARSATQILSIKGQCTFRFSNFLIIALCSSANSLLDIKSLLVALIGLESFYQTIYKLLNQSTFDIHHILDF